MTLNPQWELSREKEMTHTQKNLLYSETIKRREAKVFSNAKLGGKKNLWVKPQET